MKKIIKEEVGRIQELMGISKPILVEQSLGAILRGISGSFSDVSQLTNKLGPEIMRQVENAINKVPTTIDEIADAMDSDFMLAGRIVTKLSSLEPVLAKSIAKAFSELPEYADEWNTLASFLSSGMSKTRDEARAALKVDYGFSDEVIDLLEKQAKDLYDFGHDLGKVQREVAKNNVLTKLKELKKITNIEDPSFIKIMDEAAELLDESEITAILSKKYPNFGDLWKYAKEASKMKGYTLETFLEKYGYRPGPEWRRFMTKLGYGTADVLIGGSTLKQIGKLLLYVFMGGAIYSGILSDVGGAYGQGKETIKAGWNAATVTNEELKTQISAQLKGDPKFKDQTITGVEKTKNNPIEVSVFFSDPSYDNVFVYNDKSSRFEPKNITPNKLKVGYKDDEASFKEWMDLEGLSGTPTKSKIGGFDLNGVNYQLKADKSGFE